MSLMKRWRACEHCTWTMHKTLPNGVNVTAVTFANFLGQGALHTPAAWGVTHSVVPIC